MLRHSADWLVHCSLPVAGYEFRFWRSLRFTPNVMVIGGHPVPQLYRLLAQPLHYHLVYDPGL